MASKLRKYIKECFRSAELISRIDKKTAPQKLDLGNLTFEGQFFIAQ